MIPVKPANANFVYSAPKGMEDCNDLHVHVYDDSDVRIITSHWQPSPEEIELIRSGQPVQLHVYGHGHPVVALTVAK